MTPQPDLQWLIQRTREGDRSAFDLLIRSIEKEVVRTAACLTGNLADAEDVAQEVYVKVIRKLPGQIDDKRFRGWVYRVTVNTARDLLRKRRWWLPLDTILTRVRPSRQAERSEFEGRLVQALGQLSFSERTVFVLREIQELDGKEVAQVLGCSRVTVRSHAHRARKKLQVILHDYRRQT